MSDTHAMAAAMERLRQAEVPKINKLWTTDRSVELWDPRVPLKRDKWNKAAAEHTDSSASRWLVLCGAVGRGKTAWATGHFNDIVVDKVSKNENWGSSRSPKWITEAAMFRRADASARAGYHGRAVYLGSLIGCPLLLIDDLGGSRRPLTDAQGGAIRDLLSERHANLRTTIITTNLMCWEDIEKRYGDHVVSRLIEACGLMVKMEGPDRRISGKAVS